MVEHVFPGLQPRPLGAYLAGLGLIRLLGEQADPSLTSHWTDAGLTVQTTVPEVARWLVEDYVPTPVLSPWNEGSGFGAKDVTPKHTLEALLADPNPRFGPLRTAHTAATEVGRRYRTDPTWTKERAVTELRNQCPDELVPWIDAAVVLAGGRAYFPPVLGTGGNDGRLDFSTGFHQRLADVLAPPARQRSLAMAEDLLNGTQAERLTAAAVGQFDPGAAGGRNSSPFGDAESLINPWGYVLLIEGALLFAATAARRGQHGVGRAAMPFTVIESPDGYAAGAAGEPSRGELWTPLWHRPFTLAEIKQLFSDARASWRGRPAQRTVEFYAATRTLGVARGVQEFVRYGLHQRNGLAFVAVPIERVPVEDRPLVRLAAGLEDWVSWARRGGASTAVGQAIQAFDKAQLTFVRSGEPSDLVRLLATLVTVELAVGRSGRARAEVKARRPPSAQPFLSALRTLDSAELRVAVGIASCATLPGPDPARQPARTMRQILLPIDPNGGWREAPVVAGFGLRPLREVLADVLVWRGQTAADERLDPLDRVRGAPGFRRGMEVPAADLHAFAADELDQDRLELFVRAGLALDWRGVRFRWPPRRPAVPIPTLGLLQALAAGVTPDGDDQLGLALHPDWPALLRAGRVAEVHAAAVQRLYQAGWRAVPAPAWTVDGTAIAGALVPRCTQPERVLAPALAVRLRTPEDLDLDTTTDSDKEMS